MNGCVKPTARGEFIDQLIEGAPIVLATQPVVEVTSVDLGEVGTELRPVGPDEVYEAVVPPGTSAAP